MSVELAATRRPAHVVPNKSSASWRIDVGCNKRGQGREEGRKESKERGDRTKTSTDDDSVEERKGIGERQSHDERKENRAGIRI